MFLIAGVVPCFFCYIDLVGYKVGRSLRLRFAPLPCNLKQRYKKDF